jgi:hypothetical protein
MPLDENPQDGVRRNLACWLPLWEQACQLSGLSTQEGVQQWVERLLPTKENPDEWAGVVALLLGYGEAELDTLRGVLQRVRLRVADVIRMGEARVRNPRTTAKELSGFNDWVTRRRTVLPSQRQGVRVQPRTTRSIADFGHHPAPRTIFRIPLELRLMRRQARGN